MKIVDMSDEAIAAMCEDLREWAGPNLEATPAGERILATAANALETLAHSRDEYKRWYEAVLSERDAQKDLIDGQQKAMERYRADVERLRDLLSRIRPVIDGWAGKALMPARRPAERLAWAKAVDSALTATESGHD